MSQQFTDANFKKEVIEASKGKPVLVDFFANWCGPCKMQGPIVDELAEEMREKVIVGKVDTEKDQEIASKYDIMSIPTLMIFKNGKPVETMIGLQNKDNLKITLEKYL